VEYCFNGEAFPRFDFIQYGRHALSYVIVEVTMNVPMSEASIGHKRKPDSYSRL